MKITLLISYFLLTGYLSESQIANFSPTGNMEHSQFVFDTIINTKIISSNGSIEFSHLDSFSVEKSKYKSVLQPFISRGIRDSVEYFFIANNTKKEIVFSIPYRLFAIQIAQTNTNEFKPINYFASHMCGTNIFERKVLSGGIFIFKKGIAKNTGNLLMSSKIKISTKTNGTLISNTFKTIIDKNSFSINTSYYSDYEKYKQRIYFLDK